MLLRIRAKAIKEGGFLPSESQPSSYLVNKDILLGVIPAGQDGLLGGDFGKALTSTEASLAAIPKTCGPILSTFHGSLG